MVYRNINKFSLGKKNLLIKKTLSAKIGQAPAKTVLGKPTIISEIITQLRFVITGLLLINVFAERVIAAPATDIIIHLFGDCVVGEIICWFAINHVSTCKINSERLKSYFM